jgi:hypothetical protein
MKNNIPSFKQFESQQIIEGETSEYEPPKYVVKPAPGDKGFAMFKQAFDNQKSYFQPRIASSNQDIENNDGQTPAKPKETLA